MFLYVFHRRRESGKTLQKTPLKKQMVTVLLSVTYQELTGEWSAQQSVTQARS